MKKIRLLILIFFLSLNFLFSQENNKSKLIEGLIETLAEESDEELDYTTLLEDLNYYSENPINLNGVTYVELERLHFLTDFEIHNIISYIKKNGQLLSIYEIQLIEKLRPQSVTNLSLFVRVEAVRQKQEYALLKSLSYGQHQIFLRTEFNIETATGYSDIDAQALEENPNARYLGDKMKYYARYKYQYKDKIAWGITAEKDQGEAFNTAYNKKGFDYYSAHFQLKNIGKLKTLAIGDFQVKFGQGLVLWSGMGTKKSVYTLNLKRRENGIQKYSSVDENKFMRGVGSTVSLGNFDVSGFYSHKNIDANVSTSDTLSPELSEVSSLQTTGYHRTVSENEDRKAITETVFGGNVTYRHEKIKLGFTLLKYQFSSALNKAQYAYNLFEFQGSENVNAGLNYQFQVAKMSLFGETAVSENGQIATTNGGVINLAPQISFSLLHRYFQRGYQAYYSNAFGETGKTYNESGLYLGTEIHPYKRVKISAYFDMYRFLWLRSRVASPSHGNEIFIQLDYQVSRQLNMYVKFKYEEKGENLSTETAMINQVVPVAKTQIRYHLSYSVNKHLNLKTRFELSQYSKYSFKKTSGFLLYQDVNYLFQKIPLKLNFRYAIFDTEDYNTRIYAYENDILYGFSIPAYYSQGMRFYFNVKYSLVEDIDLWFRVAQTYYSNKETIGSGKDEIPENKKTQIKVQLRFKF